MSPSQRKRLTLIGVIILGISFAAGLAIYAMQDSFAYFVTPSDIENSELPANRNLRVGGLVVAGSISKQGLTTKFELSDTSHSVKIVFSGILPDLFREGQGIIATGQLRGDGIFVAEQVLAKHDENYMPPPVQKAITKEMESNFKATTSENY